VVTARHFVRADIRGGAVVSASNVWLSQRGGSEGASSSNGQARFEVVLTQPLLEVLLPTEEDVADGRLRRRIWCGYQRAWKTVASRRLRQSAAVVASRRLRQSAAAVAPPEVPAHPRARSAESTTEARLS
jgi:hypothetical protein